MAEDWTTLLTEKEQRRLAASSKYCHGRGLAHACCDELPGFLRSLAASRALVEEQRKAMGHAVHLTDHNKGMCARCREAKGRINEALALTEADMLERLEVK